MSVAINSPRNRNGVSRLVRLLLWVALGHLVVILILSPQLYWPSHDTPEGLFARAEQAMKDGKYADAMELYRKVMDQQPKPPPMYVKAAEQHRVADRLAKQATNKPAVPAAASPAGSPPPPSAATQPATPATPAPATKPARPFIPPELMGR